jgi:WD40 repeat protein
VFKVATFPGVQFYGAIAADNRFRASFNATNAAGDTIAVEGDGNATLVDPSGRVLATLGRGHDGVYSVAFDRLGRRLAVGNRDGVVEIYGVPSGRIETTIATGQGIVATLAFSPDGRLLATGGEDTTARLWDARSDTEVATFVGHTAPLTTLAFDPSGTYLATGSVDGTIRVYVLPVDELIAVGRERLTRGWAVAECARYLGGSCPKTP